MVNQKEFKNLSYAMKLLLLLITCFYLWQSRRINSYLRCETMFFQATKAFIALKETFSFDIYRKILTHVKEYFMDSEICIIGTKILLVTLYAVIKM